MPDHCRIEVDCRFGPALGLEQLRAAIEDVVRAAAPGASVTVQRCSPPLNTDESLPWVARLGREAGGFASSAWYADAGVLSAPHCPAVCLGPGHIAQAHTRDEFIAVDELERAAAFFRRWISLAEAAVR